MMPIMYCYAVIGRLGRIAVSRTHMRPTVLQTEQRGVSVCQSVCPSVTAVSPAKMAEPIGMPFGLWARIGPGNHVLDWVQIPSQKG